MSKVHNLTYFGSIRGLVGDGKSIVFVTEHAEGKLTSLYKINGEADKESDTLTEVALDFVPTSLLKANGCYWIGGDDSRLHCVGESDKKSSKLSAPLPAPPTSSAILSNDRIALACNNTIQIVEAKPKGKLIQSIELEEDASAIAANPDGNWLAVGTTKGIVNVYQCEDQDEFVLSESSQLHDGAVTSLLFEPDELRFFSSGNDHKLLLTHARGRLEPEDRGRSNNHNKPITSMVMVGVDRFITGSLDKSCKSWARAGATQPQTQSNDIVAVHHLAVVEIHSRPNLVVACNDDSLRLFLIDEEGRIGDRLRRYNDVYWRAKNLFQSNETSQRGLAMQELQDIGDRRSTEMLAERVSADQDSKLRLTAAQLLATSSHPQLVELLSKNLSHADAPIRMHMLKTLEGCHPDLLDLYKTVLLLDQADTGVDSVKSLVKIATGKGVNEALKNRAQSILVSALDANLVEIRNAAILGLEDLFDKKSPRSSLISLESKSEDSKRKGLIRLMQRGLLDAPAAQAGLRRAVEDPSATVRQTAFLISVLSRPVLAGELRSKDKDIDRQLSELEKFDFQIEIGDSGKSKPKKIAKRKVAKKKPK